MNITARRFLLATGFQPDTDDIERCNCRNAGHIGHFFCGWCSSCDKPRFVCGHGSDKEMLNDDGPPPLSAA